MLKYQVCHRKLFFSMWFSLQTLTYCMCVFCVRRGPETSVSAVETKPHQQNHVPHSLRVNSCSHTTVNVSSQTKSYIHFTVLHIYFKSGIIDIFVLLCASHAKTWFMLCILCVLQSLFTEVPNFVLTDHSSRSRRSRCDIFGRIPGHGPWTPSSRQAGALHENSA